MTLSPKFLDEICPECLHRMRRSFGMLTPYKCPGCGYVAETDVTVGLKEGGRLFVHIIVGVIALGLIGGTMTGFKGRTAYEAERAARSGATAQAAGQPGAAQSKEQWSQEDLEILWELYSLKKRYQSATPKQQSAMEYQILRTFTQYNLYLMPEDLQLFYQSVQKSAVRRMSQAM